MTLFDLTGRTAIITGSSRGIGRAIAGRMAEHGARVVISSRKADACDAAALAINADYPGHALAVPASISLASLAGKLWLWSGREQRPGSVFKRALTSSRGEGHRWATLPGPP